MVERIEDMPEGTIGFRVVGDLEPRDYTEVFIPPLRKLVEAGAEIRLLFVLGDEFDHFEPAAIWEDAKASWELGARHLSLWKRTALVSEVGWVRKASRAFAWMAPGDVKLFGNDQLAQAKKWVAG
jgi:hypothetical protein